MDDAQFICLKDALSHQYAIMKKLYAELEEEREASSSAVTEALSMILRVQKEKASEKMEALQYKRMAEEKMQHAEECLCILKDVTRQKEMENTSLRYQVEVYKHKLSSLGVKIPDNREIGIYCDNQMDSARFHGFVRRNFSRSFPPLGCEQLCFEMDVDDEKDPLPHRRNSIWRSNSEKYDQCENFDEYPSAGGVADWHQADDLNKKRKGSVQVRTSIGSATLQQESRSCSLYSADSGGPSKSVCSRNGMELPQFNNHGSCSESEYRENTVHCAGVHDIIEVPESHKRCNSAESCDQVLEESIPDTKHNTGLRILLPQEYMDHSFRDGNCLNAALMTGHRGNKFCTPSKTYFLHHGKKFVLPTRGSSSSYLCTRVDPKMGNGTSQIGFEQLKLQLKQLEDEHIARQKDTERGKEQMKLLREIFKQLNTMETHIKTSSPKDITQDHSKVVSVMEILVSCTIGYFSSCFMMVRLDTLPLVILVACILEDTSSSNENKLDII